MTIDIETAREELMNNKMYLNICDYYVDFPRPNILNKFDMDHWRFFRHIEKGSPFDKTTDELIRLYDATSPSKALIDDVDKQVLLWSLKEFMDLTYDIYNNDFDRFIRQIATCNTS